MNAREAIFQAAIRQHQANIAPAIPRDELAEVLIREVLDALTNQDSRVDLREWATSARMYLEVPRD